VQVVLASQTKFLTNAQADGAAVYEDGQSVIARYLEDGHQAWIGDGVCVHGREEAEAMQMGIGSGLFHAIKSVGLRGVEHEVAIKTFGMRRYGSVNTIFITGDAGDQSGTLHTVAVEFRSPAISQRDGVGGGYIEIQKRRERFGVGGFLLRRERGIKLVREEVNVSVLDCQFAPGSLRHQL
jgi:hypothetical protein